MKRLLCLFVSISAALSCAGLPLVMPISAVAQSGDQGPRLTLEQKMLLRCSIAFALTAQRQSEGNEAALRHPPLETRGGEFFVRSVARLMDEANLDRPQIIAQIAKEREDLMRADVLEQIMPACLQVLKNSEL